MHPTTTPAVQLDVDHVVPPEVLELADIERERWPEIRARIPDWHPRNDGEGAGDGGGGDGGAGEGGDGGPAQGDLYDLSAVPEELRGYVDDVVKQIQGKVTKSFEQSADFRKTWEPYAELGLTDYEPDQLSSLLEFAQIAADPEQFRGWLADVARHLHENDAQSFEKWFYDVGGELDLLDDDGEPGEGGEPEGAEALMQQFGQMLQQHLDPLNQRIDALEGNTRTSAANAAIDAQFEALAKSENDGEPFDEETRNIVGRFALAYDGADDAIARGFADYMKVVGGAQGDLVDAKSDQPAPANSGGVADTSAESFSHDDPGLKKAALARMRAS
jgi:hypothetical protein